MQTYVAPVAVLLTMMLVGFAGIAVVSLLADFGGNSGIYAGAAAVMLLAAVSLVLESRAAS